MLIFAALGITTVTVLTLIGLGFVVGAALEAMGR